MFDWFARFERIARKAGQFTEAPVTATGGSHPFDERDIHTKLPAKVKKLFDDGHYSDATFTAFKFIDKEVQRHARENLSGYKLMMKAFARESPIIKLTPLSTESERDEQNGFQFLFAGSVMAIRNPRGHEFDVIDSPDQCLDHLSLASLLLRRLEDAGFK